MNKKILFTISTAFAALCPNAHAESSKEPSKELLEEPLKKPSKEPLKVGDTAPDFTLKDESGAEYSLNEQLKTSKVAILFYRSGDW